MNDQNKLLSLNTNKQEIDTYKHQIQSLNKDITDSNNLYANLQQS